MCQKVPEKTWIPRSCGVNLLLVVLFVEVIPAGAVDSQRVNENVYPLRVMGLLSNNHNTYACTCNCYTCNSLQSVDTRLRPGNFNIKSINVIYCAMTSNQNFRRTRFISFHYTSNKLQVTRCPHA